MSAMAISLSWAVAAVAPVDDAVPLPPAVAMTSRVVVASPVTSRMVSAIADVDAAVPPTVTVTD